MNDLIVTDEHIRHSNLIEGIDNRVDDDQLMRAWRYVSGLKQLTLKSVLHAHWLITKDELPANFSGKLRTSNVRVGVRVCPSYREVPLLLDEWVHKFEIADMLDPKVMHIEFERIHPFVDGNGRSGRLFMWWHEILKGLPPTLIRVEDRWEYYQWFDGDNMPDESFRMLMKTKFRRADLETE